MPAALPHLLAGALVGAVVGVLLARSRGRSARRASAWIVVLLAAACGALMGSGTYTPPLEETPALAHTPFDELVARGVVAVDFFATWCPPCRPQARILDKVEATVGARAAFLRVDIDKHPDLAHRLNITSLPAILVFSNGVEKKRFESLASKRELIEAIEDVARDQPLPRESAWIPRLSR